MPQRHEHTAAVLGKGQDGAGLLAPAQPPPAPWFRLDMSVVFALSVAFGSAVYFGLPVEPSLVLVAGVVVGALTVWLLARRAWRVPQLAIFALVAFGLSVGTGLAKLRTLRAQAPVIQAEMPPALIEGWVVGIDSGQSGPRLTLDVHAISGLPASDTPLRVRLTHISGLRVGPGRFVRCYGVLRPPPAPSMAGDYDFQMQAWFRGLGAVGYVRGRCRGGTLGAPDGALRGARAELASVRRQFAQYVNTAAGERAGGFAAALMSGDRSFMAREDADALRGAGLAHLLAISGLHMGIVGGLVYLIMRRGLALIEPLALRVAVQKPAAMTALMASAAYLVMSGASVSTQRAFIMSAIFFGAILFDRTALSLRSFALAMIGVVAIHPESVMSPGFQMSFAATGALIATYEAWSARRREKAIGGASGLFVVQSLVMTSIVGALATAPFAIFHFGRVATWGLLANLAAMPIISFISAPMAAASLLAAPFGLSDYTLRLFGLSLEWVLSIAHALDRDVAETGLDVPTMSGAALCVFIAALSALVAIRGRGRWVALAGVSLVAMAVWMRAAQPVVHWAPSGDVFVTSADGGVQRLQFVEGDGLGPLRYVGVVITRDCRIGQCEVSSAAGPVTLHHAGPAQLSCADLGRGIHLFRNGLETFCPGSLTWSEVQRLNGQTFLLGLSGRIHRERAQTCRSRPWAGCADQS